MIQQHQLIKQQNYQLKNQISEFKNAFNLNRDILKIVCNQSKCPQPKTYLLFQIISRLTNINNQVLINTADLIHQRNLLKKQKILLMIQNQKIKNELLELKTKENQQIQGCSSKVNQLVFYFKNKVTELENQIKVLEEDRIIKKHQIQYLNNKLQTNHTQSTSLRQISTEHIFKNPARKYISKTSCSYQIRQKQLKNQISYLKLYISQLQYRLLTFIKLYQLQQKITPVQQPLNMQHRRALEQSNSKSLLQIRLIKFAINNLKKQQKQQNQQMFQITKRTQCPKENNKVYRMAETYQRKSVDKYDRVRMRPKLITKNVETQQDQQDD